MENINIWDNGGKTLDRYTVVFPDQSYVGISEDPYHPCGFFQHGDGLKYFVKQPKTFQGDKRISFEDLPIACQLAIIQELQDIKQGEIDFLRRKKDQLLAINSLQKAFTGE